MEGIDLKPLLFGVFGGLGLFIFGMQLMAEGLQKAAGDKLRRILEILTTNRIMAVITGIIVTVLVQSSSTTTVMVVGFVNAGLMTLNQAVGIIFGANIGTTITAQLVSFKGFTELALPAVAVGVILSFFTKKRFYRYLGQAILGFGVLFLGMNTMSSSLKVLRTAPAFMGFLANFGQIPILGIIAGALFTMAVQSSSASTAIVVAMTLEGVLKLDSAMALILGSNIGTCVTAMLASIGTNLTARRAAVSHVVFNVIGVIIFFIILRPFTQFVVWLTPAMKTEAELVARQVANAHTIFNITNTILVLPFVNYFVNLIKRLVPGEELIIERGVKFIDRRMLKTPAIALGAAEKEVVRMAEISQKMVIDAINILFENRVDIRKDVAQREEVIDELEKEIATYLAQLSNKGLTGKDSERLTMLLHAINDIERIGDHSENIADLCLAKIENEVPFSDKAREEIKEMYEAVLKMTNKAITALKENNLELARQVVEEDDIVDELEKKLRNKHIERLNLGLCHPTAGVVFLDIISNFERIGDHAVNLAQVVLGEY
ncbi:phosphate:Na+ symporter [Anaerobranca californiensis DSM 14826]|uniref:Phosphate:Na+ symporter n=1 Tax=Anaerobranca californiensis DSM 14826 TaxID=1120989 RepID=A0A1M6MA24_9FIRM|nr:Na/Pi cotransporter family protein [Anaerobranca californiensis]SHJ80153.1 phosphate:Na+ symporter [Anaerobranca californiensis DSM 14826]